MPTATKYVEQAKAVVRAGGGQRQLDRILPHRESLILRLRAEGKSRYEIADELDLTPERTRQIEVQANKRIEAFIRNTPRGFYVFERFG